MGNGHQRKIDQKECIEFSALNDGSLSNGDASASEGMHLKGGKGPSPVCCPETKKMCLQEEQETLASTINNIAEVHSTAFENIADAMNKDKFSAMKDVNEKLDALQKNMENLIVSMNQKFDIILQALNNKNNNS